MSLLSSLFRGILSLLYPPVCVGCRRRLDDPRPPICGECMEILAPVTARDIASILQRLPTDDSGIDIGCALWEFEKGTALQEFLHMLKYGNRPLFGRAVGRMLGEHYLEQLRRADLSPADVLLPIPLGRARYLSRGYNQSLELARGLSRAAGLPLNTGVLVRDRPTRRQTDLNRSERWENTAGAFRVTNADTITGRSVLLVDDVLTTGSTLSAAARTLRHSGVQSVHTASLAVARLYEKDHSSRP